MRAIAVRAFGGPDALELVTVGMPEPGPGEVLVKVAFAGVNYVDIYTRAGTYARQGGEVRLPQVLGREGAGEVVKLGAGVREWKPGDRVAWCVSQGAYAEYAVVPAWRLVSLPEGVPFDIACALQLQGATAHYLVTSAFPMKAGDMALVHSGAGGVGQILIQLAKVLGATVIATVGNESRSHVPLGRGADHVIVRSREDFRAKVIEITNKQGCSVVYDAIGQNTIAGSIAACRRRGLVVLYGAASGAVDSIDPLALAEAGSVFFTRPHLVDYMQDSLEVRRRASDLFVLWQDGRLKVAIEKVLPLAGAREAHEALESRQSTGKILLKVIA